jgi:hypothetical protein
MSDSQFILRGGMRFEVRPFDNGEFLVRRYELNGKSWSSFASTNHPAGLTADVLIDRLIERIKTPSTPSKLSGLINSALAGK